MPVLTLYGATGYTGRLIAAEALRAGLPVRLAGRRRDALEGLAADLGGGVEIAVADVHDSAALEALVAASDVVVSTVGPYAEHGRSVVEAVLAAGRRHVDVSAEIDYLAWVHAQDERARDAGAVLCPAAGFDGGVGDLLMGLAAGALGGPVTEARVGYLVRGGRLSAGSARSMVGVAAGGGVALVDGEVVDDPLLSHTWTIPFPEPLGPSVAVSIPAPEVLSAQRTAGVRHARAYVAVPGGAGPGGRVAAAVAGLVGPAGQLVARSWLAEPLRVAAGLLPSGPSAAGRERARCALLAEVSGPAGTRRAWVSLRDVYGTTARLATALAARLLGDPGETGVRTPAQVAGADAGRLLTETGGRWEILP